MRNEYCKQWLNHVDDLTTTARADFEFAAVIFPSLTRRNTASRAHLNFKEFAASPMMPSPLQKLPAITSQTSLLESSGSPISSYTPPLTPPKPIPSIPPDKSKLITEAELFTPPNVTNYGTTHGSIEFDGTVSEDRSTAAANNRPHSSGKDSLVEPPEEAIVLETSQRVSMSAPRPFANSPDIFSKTTALNTDF